MIEIEVLIFAFLQKKFKDKTRFLLKIKENSTLKDLQKTLEIKDEEVEAFFVNGKISSLKTILKNQDRVGVVPPGMPGPYRFLLGMLNKDE